MACKTIDHNQSTMSPWFVASSQASDWLAMVPASGKFLQAEDEFAGPTQSIAIVKGGQMHT